MKKRSLWPSSPKACGLALLVWTVPWFAAQAQTYQQVAPSQPTREAVPNGSGAASSAASQTQPTGAANIVQLKRLKGVYFVSSAKEVRLGGVSGRETINPGDVPFAGQPEFQAIVQPFIGQPVTMASLDRLTSGVVQYYRQHDRPIVNVFVPQQNITNGYVQIVVAEGRAGKVVSSGAEWYSNQDLRQELRLHAGDPISGEQLRNDVDWMNRNPFHQSDILFGPGDLPGQTDVTLKTVDRFPVRVFAGLDDEGNQAIGDYRYFTGFNYGDLFGLGQQVSYQYTATEDSNQFFAHSGSYVIPLPWHHLLTFFGSYGEANSKEQGMIQEGGVNWQTSMRYEIPLYSTPSFKQSVTGGFDFKQSNNNLAFGGMSVSNTYTDIAQFVLAYQCAYTDPYGTTSFGATGYISPGNLSGNDVTANYQAMRYGATPDYLYGQLSLQRIQKLPWDFTLNERVLLQGSNANLLSSEQFGLGGFDTVRGYDERIVNGDSGFLTSTELETPPISLGNLVGIAKASDRFQLLAFVDYAGESPHTADPSNANPNANLLGVGPGIRYEINPYMTFRFDYGFQLMKAGLDNQDNSRGHIGLVVSLPPGNDVLLSSTRLTSDTEKKAVTDANPSFIENADLRKDGTGWNTGIDGGVAAFQDGASKLTSPNTSSILNASAQSEPGGVAGLHVGYTCKDSGSGPAWLLPAVDTAFQWTGFKYRADATTSMFSGSYVSTNVNTYSLLLEPKLKFRFGAFRPYIGAGVGATYLTADNPQVNLQGPLPPPSGPITTLNTTYGKSLQAGALTAAGLVGAEYFIDQHWALDLEYQYNYLDLQGSLHSKISGTPVAYSLSGLSSQIFTSGISYYY